MAQSSSGIHGAFKGRIGNVVFYLRNGKQVARTLPQIKPRNTGPRKKVREDFALVMKVLKSVIDFIRMGYHDVSQGSMAFHSALSENLKRIRASEDPGGLHWLLPTMGSRAGAQDVAMQRSGNQVTVSWGQPTPAGVSKQRDLALFLAINTSSLASTISSEATRGSGQCTFTLPPSKDNEEVLVFLSFYDPLALSAVKNPANISQAQRVQ